MLKIGVFSAKLLFQGKLIRDPMYVTQQIIIGVAIGLLLLLSLAQLKLSLWLSVAISSLITGAIMPFLLKDLKTG